MTGRHEYVRVPAARVYPSRAFCPSSIPKSVMLPVICVARTLPTDVLEPIAFCNPIMKLSSKTVAGAANSGFQLRAAQVDIGFLRDFP